MRKREYGGGVHLCIFLQFYLEETIGKYFQKYRLIWVLIMFVTMVTDYQIVVEAV